MRTTCHVENTRIIQIIYIQYLLKFSTTIKSSFITDEKFLF